MPPEQNNYNVAPSKVDMTKRIKETKTEIVHFVICGEFLTRMARTLWADEGEVQKALNILDCLDPKIPRAIQMAILTGSKKLTGDSTVGINLEDDNAEKTEAGNPLYPQQELKRLRAENDRLLDQLQLAAGDIVLLGSPDGAVFVPRRKTVEMGLGRRRLADGVTLESIPCRYEPGLSRVEKDLTQAEKDAATLFRAFPKKDAEDDEDEEKYDPPEAFSGITEACGWLSPEGKFYPCEYAGHATLAHRLAPNEYSLERLNWIKVQNGKFFRDDYHRPPTQAQIDVVFDWAQKQGVKMPWLSDADVDADLEDSSKNSPVA